MMKNPPHPGIGLKHELDELGLSVAEAAKALGVTRQQLYRLIKGECGITPEMALRLELAIGSSADFWLRLQMNYDLAQVRRRAASIHVRKLARPEVA
ncbi:MAG TPA: HigA family addiction module antitoxin [Roseiarcus sp.]|nr:HigA family addiction module antitoxin [Roseiarcus sp.]